MRHGTGTYYYSDGVRIYRGEWKDNVRLSSPAVSCLRGCLKLKHGRGTFTYENGDKYDGEWLNNKQVRKITFLRSLSVCSN